MPRGCEWCRGDMRTNRGDGGDRSWWDTSAAAQGPLLKLAPFPSQFTTLLSHLESLTDF